MTNGPTRRQLIIDITMPPRVPYLYNGVRRLYFHFIIEAGLREAISAIFWALDLLSFNTASATPDRDAITLLLVIMFPHEPRPICAYQLFPFYYLFMLHGNSPAILICFSLAA